MTDADVCVCTTQNWRMLHNVRTIPQINANLFITFVSTPADIGRQTNTQDQT